MPRTIGGNSGLVMSGRTRPTVPDFDVLRLRAIGFGEKPSDSAARSTRRAVSVLTSRRVSGFSARDAVAAGTPATTATSGRVGGDTTGILGWDRTGADAAVPVRRPFVSRAVSTLRRPGSTPAAVQSFVVLGNQPRAAPSGPEVLRRGAKT